MGMGIARRVYWEFEDLSVVCIVEFIGHLLSDRDIIRAVPEWERD